MHIMPAVSRGQGQRLWGFCSCCGDHASMRGQKIDAVPKTNLMTIGSLKKPALVPRMNTLPCLQHYQVRRTVVTSSFA